jgi:AcrR family transcriptional regulator
MPQRQKLSPAPRSPRRDAVRNDAVVLKAAREVFAEQGPQASMETIATRAGVGVGTIYRRFAGKEALLDAIAQLFAEEIDAAVDAALQASEPGAGLEHFLEFVGRFNAEKRRYAAALAERADSVGMGGAPSDAARADTAAKIQQLTQKAVDAGALAPHVTASDIKALLVAIRALVAAAPDEDNESWQRFLRIHLNGLRTG